MNDRRVVSQHFSSSFKRDFAQVHWQIQGEISEATYQYNTSFTGPDPAST